MGAATTHAMMILAAMVLLAFLRTTMTILNVRPMREQQQVRQQGRQQLVLLQQEEEEDEEAITQQCSFSFSSSSSCQESSSNNNNNNKQIVLFLNWTSTGVSNNKKERTKNSLKHFMLSYWKNNTFCNQIAQLQQQQQHCIHINDSSSRSSCSSSSSSNIAVNISLGCKELFQEGNLGTGNYLAGLYGIRMVAAVVPDVHQCILKCHDAIAQSRQLILPWIMGSYHKFDKDDDDGDDDQSRRWPSVSDACSTYNKVPIGYMVPEMRHDLRRMAISLVGIPSPDHPAAAWVAKQQEQYSWSDSWQSDNPKQQQHHHHSRHSYRYHHQLPMARIPLFPNVGLLDDAVIHFRCGDVLHAGISLTGYGFMKFAAYARQISPMARSIGIVTQPFHANKTNNNSNNTGSASIRPKDKVSSSDGDDRCRILVTALVDYLQERFPRSKIRIHNGPNETMALAYARMIMANQTFTGMSSFGVFAVVATFGTGYLRRQNAASGPHQWTDKFPRIADTLDNVVLVDEPNVILGSDVRDMWNQRGKSIVLSWFRNETLMLRCNNTMCTF